MKIKIIEIPLGKSATLLEGELDKFVASLEADGTSVDIEFVQYFQNLLTHVQGLLAIYHVFSRCPPTDQPEEVQQVASAGEPLIDPSAHGAPTAAPDGRPLEPTA